MLSWVDTALTAESKLISAKNGVWRPLANVDTLIMVALSSEHMMLHIMNDFGLHRIAQNTEVSPMVTKSLRSIDNFITVNL